MSLDLEALAFLPDEHKTRYREIEELVGTDGWKWLMIWAKANIEDQESRLVNASSWEAHRLAFGSKMAFTALLNFAQETEAEYVAIVDAIKEEVQLADEEGNE